MLLSQNSEKRSEKIFPSSQYISMDIFSNNYRAMSIYHSHRILDIQSAIPYGSRDFFSRMIVTRKFLSTIFVLSHHIFSLRNSSVRIFHAWEKKRERIYLFIFVRWILEPYLKNSFLSRLYSRDPIV